MYSASYEKSRDVTWSLNIRCLRMANIPIAREDSWEEEDTELSISNRALHRKEFSSRELAWSRIYFVSARISCSRAW
jgi:hypothetical protein